MVDHPPALAPAAAQALAERVARGMYARDSASQALGMLIVRVAPGHAELAMVVQALDALGLLLSLGECGQQHRGKNRDDGNHHEQLDEGESGTG